MSRVGVSDGHPTGGVMRGRCRPGAAIIRARVGAGSDARLALWVRPPPPALLMLRTSCRVHTTYMAHGCVIRRLFRLVSFAFLRPALVPALRFRNSIHGLRGL